MDLIIPNAHNSPAIIVGIGCRFGLGLGLAHFGLRFGGQLAHLALVVLAQSRHVVAQLLLLALLGGKFLPQPGGVRLVAVVHVALFALQLALRCLAGGGGYGRTGTGCSCGR